VAALATRSNFVAAARATSPRPEPSEESTDEAWADYLFTRTNPKGVGFERWVHAFGCHQWFNPRPRLPVTHEIKAVYRMGEARPDDRRRGRNMTGRRLAIGA